MKPVLTLRSPKKILDTAVAPVTGALSGVTKAFGLSPEKPDKPQIPAQVPQTPEADETKEADVAAEATRKQAEEAKARGGRRSLLEAGPSSGDILGVPSKRRSLLGS